MFLGQKNVLFRLVPRGVKTDFAKQGKHGVCGYSSSKSPPQQGEGFGWWRAEACFTPLGAVYRMLTTASTSSCVSAWPSCAFTVMLLW